MRYIPSLSNSRPLTRGWMNWKRRGRCFENEVGRGRVVPWVRRRMRPKGLVGESAGTFQLHAGVRGVVKVDDDEGTGDEGGSEPANWRLFGPREGVHDKESARGRFVDIAGDG